MSKYTVVLIGSLVLIATVTAWVTHGLLTEDEITPNDEFFEMSIGVVPDIDGDAWSLTVDGHVDNSTTLTLEELRAMPAREVTAPLKCVEGPSGTAVWKGVPLHEVLDPVGVRKGAVDVVFHAADDYDSSLDLGFAMEDDVLLCYEMNGQTLPKDQGFPLKVVAPGKAGYKWVKWVVRVEVVDYDHKGYWESRGWDDEADLVAWADWLPHSIGMTIAALFGGLAAVSGLRTSRETAFWRDLPRWFSRGLHLKVSWVYLAVLYGTLVYWAIATYIRRGDLFYSSHGLLALTVVSVQTFGLAAGVLLERGNERFRRVHFISNLLAFLLLLGTIAVGLLLI
jgi:DMSO/TMAO reductase YedYZ molybdopterin-dependent catalytic subunit